MKNQIHFELLSRAEAGNALLQQAGNLLMEAASEKIRGLASRVPTALLEEEDRATLVFAGQYSAGKSTILKVLTGERDIATGAGITTQEAHEYEWNGIKVIDTPGIHTVLRPDHDDISYRAVSRADLLVFVVTNELFDAHLAEHFRKLAILRDKAHEMMLVVNKMRRCAGGNTPAARDVIREDLRKVLIPFSPEDLHLSFIDAESALEAEHEADPETAELLRRKSGLETFVKELNAFVREKGLVSRCTTALYALEQVILEAMSAEPTGDMDVDALKEVLVQKRRVLFETRQGIAGAVASEIVKAVALVRREGAGVADRSRSRGMRTRRPLNRAFGKAGRKSGAPFIKRPMKLKCILTRPQTFIFKRPWTRKSRRWTISSRNCRTCIRPGRNSSGA